MSERFTPKPVENYTNAFLWSFWLLLFMTFWVMAAIWGFFVVFATAWALDRLFTWPWRQRSDG